MQMPALKHRSNPSVSRPARLERVNLSVNRLRISACITRFNLFSAIGRRRIALPLCLLALAQRSPAQPPAAPAPQPPTQIASGTISGFITDRDGDSIPGARITLTLDPQPSPPGSAPGSAPRVATTTSDGGFTFLNVPPGPFSLTVSATGFATRQTSGQLHPAEAVELPDIGLNSASTTNIVVDANQNQIAEIEVREEEKQRVLGIIPNFYVVYEPNPAALSPRQKSDLALKILIDPVNFAITGIIAGAEQATDTYAWEQGAGGFGKRYAANFGTGLTGDLLTNAILPILLKQDPRYYYKGTGGLRKRALYAITNAVICKGDNHHWQPNYSAILGNLGASALSNVYYPAPNRAGASLTFEGAAIGTGSTAIANLIQEFLIRKITPHLPKPTHPTPNPTPIP